MADYETTMIVLGARGERSAATNRSVFRPSVHQVDRDSKLLFQCCPSTGRKPKHEGALRGTPFSRRAATVGGLVNRDTKGLLPASYPAAVVAR